MLPRNLRGDKGMPNSKARKRQPTLPAFRRYTNLAAAIHMLQTQQITLLNPTTWDDKNDAYFMAEYKRIIGAQTVLAVCFAQSSETYHHWRVFSNGSDGVCIEFDKDALVSMFSLRASIRTGRVKYHLIDTLLRKSKIDPHELPFLKRRPYKDEREYRIVYVDEVKAQEFQNFPIQATWIKRITLSPWMSTALRYSVVKTLKSIPGCAGLSIVRSTLLENDRWKSITARAQ